MSEFEKILGQRQQHDSAVNLARGEGPPAECSGRIGMAGVMLNRGGRREAHRAEQVSKSPKHGESLAVDLVLACSVWYHRQRIYR